ncbi:hypothetical protein DDB_G0291099 [Dictyostelium discoideum AX4]|uniref:Uncharacterized protein n=1 Tax=Dictyostelium discoideum TaxID=44689 RepID=Q54F51_DICDI|nr:hypothetical protein DDB_G0291099 [Dictyostelium discoideum AX4]EAL61897.1 hypothetical protein DDB_G0291099 [Dictyostelium discoideum AX4]|eukprot:XP_635403.1 hypothetical protein DDB_G0291099 [Dictyostelium discoideum AX4]
MNYSNNEDKQELITIQIGNFSNFIGAHFWNIQEENYQYSKREQSQYEIEPEMLFRSNINSETFDKDIKYTPRLLLFDFKSNFGSMNSDGKVLKQTSKNIDNNDILNSGSGGSSVNKIIKQSTGKPIDRENTLIDNSNVDFEYWSDYLNVDYNSRGLISIPDSLLNIGSQVSGSANGLIYDDGFDMFESNYEYVTDIYQDNLRRMIEECDNLSGFQCLIDTDGIWGGVSTSVLSHIQDEYSSKVISTWASTNYNHQIDLGNEESIDERIYNSSKTIQSIAPSSGTGLTDLFIPLSCQRWWSTNKGIMTPLGSSINKSKYQTSAEIAASIDTATLYYRSNYSSQTLSSFVSHLTSSPSRKLCVLSSSFPNRLQEFGFTYSSSKYSREPTFPNQPLYSHPLMNYLSPRIEQPVNLSTSSSNPLTEIISLRGIDIFKSIDHHHDRSELLNNYDKISSLFKIYLSNSYNGHGRSVLNRSIVNIVQPFIMKKNHFPVLSNNKNKNNNNQNENNNINNNSIEENQEIIENPNTILTHLQNTNLIHPFIQYLNQGYKQIVQSKRMKRLTIDQDSFAETIEILNYLSDSYQE